MKTNLRTLTMALVAAAAVSCGNPESKAPVFVTDDYGVVEKINPQDKEVYLVFTGHYSHADSGRFENFDGVVPVLNTLEEKVIKEQLLILKTMTYLKK